MDLETGRPGLRARSKARRRQLILHTALALFAERGYDRTTIADIAEASDVAPRTVTGYFPSKLDFILEWPMRLETRLIDLYRGHVDLDIIDLIDLWWHDIREGVDRTEATLTRAMALTNPGVVAMAEAEVARRIADDDGDLPSRDAEERDDLLRVAGREAVRGINQAFFRGIAEDRMTDELQADLLDVIRTITQRTGLGHGSLERGGSNRG